MAIRKISNTRGDYCMFKVFTYQGLIQRETQGVRNCPQLKFHF
jgi:hypothetical protein